MLFTGQSQASPGTTFITGHAATSPPRLALSELETHVSQYLEQAPTPSTLQSYKSGQRRFLHFCAESGMQPHPLSESATTTGTISLAACLCSFHTWHRKVWPIRLLSLIYLLFATSTSLLVTVTRSVRVLFPASNMCSEG